MIPTVPDAPRVDIEHANAAPPAPPSPSPPGAVPPGYTPLAPRYTPAPWRRPAPRNHASVTVDTGNIAVWAH